MSRPMFSPAARRDLNQILDYISQQSPRNALRLIDRLLTKCELLADSPDMGEPCVVGKFDGRVWPAGKYLIFYRTVLDSIEIVRVLHGARDWAQVLGEDEATGSK